MTMGRRCKFSGEKAAGGTSAARHPGEANKGGPWPDGPLGDGAIPPPFARPGGMKMGDSFHGFGDGGGAKSDPGQGKRRIRITRACPKVQAGHVLAPTMESSDADGVARCVPKLCERCERASERARLEPVWTRHYESHHAWAFVVPEGGNASPWLASCAAVKCTK